MKQLDFSVYFSIDHPKPVYVYEQSSFHDERDVVNFLFQGFVRCINNLRKGFFGWDNGSANSLYQFMKEIVVLVIQREDDIKTLQNQGNTNILEALKQLQIRYSGQSFIGSLNDVYTQVKSEEVKKSGIHVNYQLQYGPFGPAMMYGISLRMNNVLQVSAYYILVKHLLPLLSLEAAKTLAHYLLGAFIAVDDGGLAWSKTKQMPAIIFSATDFLRRQGETCGNFYKEMEKVLPRRPTV